MNELFGLTEQQRAQLCPVIPLIVSGRLSEAAQKAIDLGYLITVHMQMERGEGLYPSGFRYTFDPDDDNYALNVLSLFEWWIGLKRN
jgi:hypothetical protein